MAEERQPSRRLHESPAVRREDQARDALPVSGDAQRAMPATRRAEHGGEDGGRNRADPAGGDQAWPVFRRGEGGTSAVSEAPAGMPGDAGGDPRKRLSG